jgi:hypothetical protein
MRPQRVRPAEDRVEDGLRQHEHGARGLRPDRVLPHALGVGQRLVAEVVAVRERVEHRLVAVAAGPDLLDLAVRDEEGLVRLVSELDNRVARRVLPLLEPVRERVEHLVVLVAPQQRQLAELGRDDLGTVAAAGEREPAVADGVGQAAVHPVRAARDLYPGQHREQPARRDRLHLGDGLRGRGEVPRRVRRQAPPWPFFVRPGTGRHRFRHRHNTPPIMWSSCRKM